MKLFIACLIFVIFVAPSNAVLFPGHCPTVILENNFNLQRFLGTWHKQASYPIAGNRLCSVTLSNRDATSVLYTATIFTKRNTIAKTSNILDNFGGGRLQLMQGTTVAFQFNVLATDYQNYAISYSCINKGDKHDTFISIMTRTPNPSADVVKTARNKMAEKRLSLVHLTDLRSPICNNLN